jgi:catechol 2,3-dioxygenase-like lactoylglutathione lyase family enzyme
VALIHTCYRITDIDRSVAFYEALGFKEVGRIPIRDEAVNVFMNQPGDGDMPRLELTYNFGVDSYDIGTDANLDYTAWRRLRTELGYLCGGAGAWNSMVFAAARHQGPRAE